MRKMKRLIFAVLMMVCSVSWAEWELIGKDFVGDFIYCDKSTIRKNGAISRMWVLTDFSRPRKLDSTGDRYMSGKEFWAYNCREEKFAVISIIQHSGEMGGGDVVWSGTWQERDWKWRPVPPGTTAEATWKIACG